MRIIIRHAKHYEWVHLRAGEQPEPGEECVTPFPQAPQIRTVLRAVDSDPDQHFTTMDIPAEVHDDMAQRYAEGKGLSTVTKRHHLEVLKKHIEDVVHEYHSPIEHWTAIECDDPKTEKYLQEHFLAEE